MQLLENFEILDATIQVPQLKNQINPNGSPITTQPQPGETAITGFDSAGTTFGLPSFLPPIPAEEQQAQLRAEELPQLQVAPFGAEANAVITNTAIPAEGFEALITEMGAAPSEEQVRMEEMLQLQAAPQSDNQMTEEVMTAEVFEAPIMKTGAAPSEEQLRIENLQDPQFDPQTKAMIGEAEMPIEAPKGPMIEMGAVQSDPQSSMPTYNNSSDAQRSPAVAGPKIKLEGATVQADAHSTRASNSSSPSLSLAFLFSEPALESSDV